MARKNKKPGFKRDVKKSRKYMRFWAWSRSRTSNSSKRSGSSVIYILLTHSPYYSMLESVPIKTHTHRIFWYFSVNDRTYFIFFFS